MCWGAVRGCTCVMLVVVVWKPFDTSLITCESQKCATERERAVVCVIKQSKAKQSKARQDKTAPPCCPNKISLVVMRTLSLLSLHLNSIDPSASRSLIPKGSDFTASFALILPPLPSTPQGGPPLNESFIASFLSPSRITTSASNSLNFFAEPSYFALTTLN